MDDPGNEGGGGGDRAGEETARTYAAKDVRNYSGKSGGDSNAVAVAGTKEGAESEIAGVRLMEAGAEVSMDPTGEPWRGVVVEHLGLGEKDPGDVAESRSDRTREGPATKTLDRQRPYIHTTNDNYPPCQRCKKEKRDERREKDVSWV